MMRTIGVMAVLLGLAPVAGEAAEAEIPEILVIGVTPFGGGSGEAYSHVQTATAEDLAQGVGADLSRFLDRAFANVFVNDAQNNPLQGDLMYRGFTASPLLGNPQGLVVYRDGVRQNDPFGDTVNWALIPKAALAKIELIGGANPLFGQNSLGGALVLHSKTGFSHQGGGIGIEGGSFGRVEATAELGTKIGEDVAVYAMAHLFDEAGWRDFSPSTAGQGYANLAFARGETKARLALSLASTDLIGNGPAPIELLEQDRSAIFTRPDQTRNDFIAGEASVNQAIGDGLDLDALLYVRRLVTKGLNGDATDFEACDDDPSIVCDDDGPVSGLDGAPIGFSEAVDGATLNRNRGGQTAWGAALQMTATGNWFDRDNRLIVGVSLDRGRVGFADSSELGMLDDSRAAIGSGKIVQESLTSLVTRSRHLGLFVSESFAATPRLRLSLSGRYNDSRVRLIDRIGDALNGLHDFSRFNPAGGLTYRIGADTSFYAGYGASNRVPSPVELSCADPDDPCRLPNALLSDPPLKQVVAQSLEAGLRGNLAGVAWQAGGFNIRARNDILFISAGAFTNEGFFSNVGDTRRRGAEFSASGTAGDAIDWHANYSYTAAEFREAFVVASPNHPDAVDGEIPVEPGDRLPGVPAHLLKAGAEIELPWASALALDLVYNSSLRLRGDEGNLAPPVKGGIVVDLAFHRDFGKGFRFDLKIANLLNRKYENFGLFGEPDDVLGDEFEDSRFLGPAAPRGVWAGVGYRF